MYATEKIAILMATYNGEAFVGEQLDSLLGQSCGDWTLFVHDDGSTDRTVDILRAYAARYPEKIVLVEGAPTGGARNNFFYLLGAVEAPVYMFSDQDDVWLPEKIEREYRVYRERETAEAPVLVFTDLRIVSGKLETIAPSLWGFFGFETREIRMESLILQNVVTGCTMLFNRKLRDMMLQSSDLARLPMHDKWGAMIALRFGTLCPLPEQTILYRQHELNSVGVKKGGGIGYMVGKLENLRKLRQTYAQTRQQAAAFCDAFDLDGTELLRRYAETEKLGKAGRLRFYLRHHFHTNRASQFLGMILAG